MVVRLQLAPGEGGRECCTANRKAAIVKFREKRKARNFEKKVRYESRRRLAEATCARSVCQGRSGRGSLERAC